MSLSEKFGTVWQFQVCCNVSAMDSSECLECTVGSGLIQKIKGEL